MKYPGAFILNEVGTRKELADIYGVSERTIYRWLNKAADETGVKLTVKNRRPRLSTLEKFTGTRKQLAKKYGVSERTVYRWLNKASLEGKNVSRRQRSKYPGPGIIADNRTTKEIAADLGVTPRTVSRWKAKARLETAHTPQPTQEPPATPQDTTPPLEDIGEPWEVPEPEDVGEPWEVPEPEDIGEPWEVPEPEYSWKEDYEEDYEIPKFRFDEIVDIANLLHDVNLIEEDNPFWNLDPLTRILYLDEYIQYQAEHNPKAFYEVSREFGYIPYDDPELMAMVNIWGEEFDNWLTEKVDIDNL